MSGHRTPAVYYWLTAVCFLVFAFVIIMIPGPDKDQLNVNVYDLAKRVERLEKQQCSIMSIETPDGRKTVCAVLVEPSK